MPPTEKQAEKDKWQAVKDYERSLDYVQFEVENHFPSLMNLPNVVNIMNSGAFRKGGKDEVKKDKKSLGVPGGKNKLEASFDSRLDISSVSALGV